MLLLGQTIACAGMVLGKEVSWFPTYGPEMRGGRAACWVVVSDETIGSPVVSHPDAGILLDPVAVGERAATLHPDGTLVLNTSLIRETPPRNDLRVVCVRANEIAEQLGNVRVANMVLLGAYAERTGVLPLECLPDALKHALPERHHQFIPLNIRAIEAGAECIATGKELVSA